MNKVINKSVPFIINHIQKTVETTYSKKQKKNKYNLGPHENSN